jgi:hypothetical protein
VLTNKNLRRLRAAAFIAATAAGTLVLAAGTAVAAPPAGTLGSLALSPATGTNIQVPTAQTSTGCPSGTTNYYAYLQGPGAPWTTASNGRGAQVVAPTDVNLSTGAGFPVQFTPSFTDAATSIGTTITAGEYDVTLTCSDDLGSVLGTFTTAVYFTDATHYVSTDPNAPVTTSTSLGVLPAAPVTVGTSVTLTATVSPASATGSVQFEDGGSPLGSPITVSGGTATLNTLALAAGTHSLTAVFTGSAANITGSASNAVSYQVNTAPATPTSTALSVTPSGSVAQYTAVTLNATVAPASATGTIQFTDGGSNFGTPVPVSGGSATLVTSTLSVGSHSFTAKFVPANPTVFTASESDAVGSVVTAFTGVSTPEDIALTIAPGSLVLSVDNASVVLPSPVLNPDATRLLTSGALNTITVTDTRAGNPGFSVSGQISDFTDGSGHIVNGADVGWTPKVVDHGAGQTVAAGPVVAPADGLAPGVGAAAGIGLAASRILASAIAGAGTGSAHLGADLSLILPTGSVAGTYHATLTLTAI